MTKKYSSNDKDKQYPDKQDDSFYDVSFDLPVGNNDDSHSSPKATSNQQDKDISESPSKWEGFYDKFKEEQEANFERAKREQEELAKISRQTELDDLEENSEEAIQDEAAKSSLMLDRSIRRVRSLFADFDNFEAPVANPYKSDATKKFNQKAGVYQDAEQIEKIKSTKLDRSSTPVDKRDYLTHSFENSTKNDVLDTNQKESMRTQPWSKDKSELSSKEIDPNLVSDDLTGVDALKNIFTTPSSVQSDFISELTEVETNTDTPVSDELLSPTFVEKEEQPQTTPESGASDVEVQINSKESNDEINSKWYQRLNPFNRKSTSFDEQMPIQKAFTAEMSEPISFDKSPKGASSQNNDTDLLETAPDVPLSKSINPLSVNDEIADHNSIHENQFMFNTDSQSDRIRRSRQYSSDLPSPEEIRRERERRRRMRVQELEQMTSSEEVEQSYKQSYSAWLKDFNRKKTTQPDSDIENYQEDDKISFTDTLDSEANIETDINTETDDIQVDDHIDNTIIEDLNDPIFEDTIQDNAQMDDDSSVEHTVPNNIHENENRLNDIVLDTSPSLFESSSSVEQLDEINKVEKLVEDIPVNSLVETQEEDRLVETVQIEPEEEISEDIPSEDENIQDLSLNINPTGTEADAETLIDASLNSDHEISNLNSTIEEIDQSKPDLGETIELSEVQVMATDNESAHFTVIHEPVDVESAVTKLNDETESSTVPQVIPVYKRKNKETKKEIYSLDSFSKKEKVFFGINITFNVVKRLILYLVLIGVLGGAMAAGAGFGYFANLVSKTEPPSQEDMASAINRLEQQSTLYYASGEPIANVRADVVRTITNIDEISNYIIDGLVATEDEDFYNHPGVMPKAIFRAVIETILTSDGTGGSTLTQQLVKQQLLSPDVTFFRKANEILLALRLENYFTKDQIITAYLNVSPFGRNNNGDNVAGIMKAAEGIFGVEPSEVSLPQAAFLVGLPQDPYTYTPYDQTGNFVEDFEPGIERMKEVLYRMYREEKINKDEYEAAIAYDITQDFLPQETRDEQRQSYLYNAMMGGAIEQLMLLNIQEDSLDWKKVYEDVDWYNEYYFEAEEQLRTGGYKVYTTIDKEIYDQLQVSAVTHNSNLGATYDGVFVNPETGAETYYIEDVQTGIVVIENATGKVLGFVSGTDFENNQIDHAFNMRRSPGSTIKPLAVYGPAIQENLINPSTIIPDTAYVYTSNDGVEWTPTNYGGVVSGTFYSARTALMKSDNIPTVRIYEQLLNRKVPIIDYLEKMGFNTVDSYTESDTHNLAFSLGGVTTGPTVFEQTRAFSTFANNGQYVDGYYIERIEDVFGNVVFQQDEAPVEVFSQDSNYLMVDMLRDTMNGGSGQTAAATLNFGGDWISKSGISENSKDIWFIGSTPSITVGSWIGYDNQYAEYVFDLNDGFDREAVRSQTYWGNIVNDLYALRPEIFGIDLTFTQPETVQAQTVLQSTGTLPGSVQVNNRTYQVTSPTYEDLFKTSNPAPALSYNFMFNATDSDHQTFWAGIVQAIQQQQQQQQQQQESSSSSSESEESSSDETSEENSDESTSEDTPPAE
ncbi:transglycosylase domain-containing protein [Fundicoccus ignavus]|nr:transglycosylase domain-containing protein [Fundicoccus ignavus]